MSRILTVVPNEPIDVSKLLRPTISNKSKMSLMTPINLVKFPFK